MAPGKDPRRKVVQSLNRIEGQVKGIRKMVEEERECIDVLGQVSAVQGALASLMKDIVKGHLNNCIEDSFKGKKGRRKLVDDLTEILGRISR